MIGAGSDDLGSRGRRFISAVWGRRLARAACAAVIVGAAQVPIPVARACGVSASGGISACSLEEHDEAVRPRWTLGVSALYTSTALRFNESLRAAETRRAFLAALSYAPTRRLTLQAALGATLGGALDTPTGSYRFAAGPSAAAGLTWRAVERRRVFVMLTSLLSFSSANTALVGTNDAAVRYTAFDLRVGAVAGATLFDRVSPYLLARAFGGPVYWRYQGTAVTGTDTHHYQVGGGVALRLARVLDFYAEGIPLGERAVSAGAAVVF
jgi:hypothetical protein